MADGGSGSCGESSSGARRWQQRWLLPLSAILPGALLGGYDALSFLTASRLDPVSYQIIIKTRVVLTALIWQATFKQSVSAAQWCALLLFIASSAAKATDHLSSATGHWHDVALALLQAALGSMGSVAGEKLLRQSGMSVDGYNLWLSFWGLALMLWVQLHVDGPSGMYANLIAPEAWRRLSTDAPMVLAVLTLAISGITASYFVRAFTSITKELCGVLVIVVSSIIEWFVLASSPATTQGWIAVIASIAAAAVYSCYPITPDAKHGDDRLQSDSGGDSAVEDDEEHLGSCTGGSRP